jgi:LCP family protein required for cell wall assembly
MTNMPIDDAASIPPARVRTPVGVRKKSSTGEKVLFAMLGLFVIIAALALYTQISPSYTEVPNTVAAGLKADRVNILVIGIGGDGHPGGGIDLADSILLVSLKPSQKKAALISIPRDFYLKIGHYGMHRLNDAHALGENAGYPGGGPGLTIDQVKAITGQPINAYIRLDFKAFEKIIDDLGGVDVYVYRPFHDQLFNDTFQQGWQHMNGHRALQYARYRYIIGLEGTNFARELRQQQIVSAIRKKMQNLTPAQALRLAMSASSVSHYTKTNLSTPQMVQLYNTFHDMNPANVRHVSLQPMTEIFMLTKINDSGEAVRPRNGDYGPIRATIQNVFNDTRPVVTPSAIQLTDDGTPQPSMYAGDDTLMARTTSARR